MAILIINAEYVTPIDIITVNTVCKKDTPKMGTPINDVLLPFRIYFPGSNSPFFSSFLLSFSDFPSANKEKKPEARNDPINIIIGGI